MIKITLTLFTLIAQLVFSSQTSAQSLDAMKATTKLYRKLTKVTPRYDNQVLQEAASIYDSQGSVAASNYIIENAPEFADIALTQMFKPFSNREEVKKDISVNDMVYTFIGATLDSDTTPFFNIFFDNRIYTGPSFNNRNARFRWNNTRNHFGQINQRLERRNNFHIKDNINLYNQYSAIVTEPSFNYDEDDQEDFVSRLGNTGAVGVYTVPTASYLHDAGTQRRPFYFALKHLFCAEIENFHDVTTPDTFVRRDVGRGDGLGEDPTTYQTTCKGCHAGMDSMSKAWCSHTAQGRQVRFRNQIEGKCNQNNNIYPQGASVTNTNYVNLWMQGPNAAKIGWRSSQNYGTGATSLMQMMTQAEAASKCWVQRVFKQVCVSNPTTEDQPFIESMVQTFENSNYNLKAVFAQTAAYCGS